MTNRFEVRYSPTFYNDFERIILYIKYELKNVIAANNLLNKVEKEINHRLENPLGYEKYKTKAGNIYYRIYIKNYIIFYTVSDNTMVVRRMIYKKRNLEELL